MLHEYHAQMMIQDRERHLRQVTEHARLHREAVGAEPHRPRWASAPTPSHGAASASAAGPASGVPAVAARARARTLLRCRARAAGLGMMRRCS